MWHCRTEWCCLACAGSVHRAPEHAPFAADRAWADADCCAERCTDSSGGCAGDDAVPTGPRTRIALNPTGQCAVLPLRTDWRPGPPRRSDQGLPHCCGPQPCRSRPRGARDVQPQHRPVDSIRADRRPRGSGRGHRARPRCGRRHAGRTPRPPAVGQTTEAPPHWPPRVVTGSGLPGVSLRIRPAGCDTPPLLSGRPQTQ